MKVRMEFTEHSINRLDGRMSQVVKIDEVVKAIAIPLPLEKSVVEVKRLPQPIEIADPTVKPDGIARGDQIVAVVQNYGTTYRVVTVALRKSWSKSNLPEYQTIYGQH